MNTYEITTWGGWRGIVQATDSDTACKDLVDAPVSMKLDGEHEMMMPYTGKVEDLEVRINEIQQDILNTNGHGRRARYAEQKANLQAVLDELLAEELIEGDQS